eukprot:CAMPEP_0183569868 /NCGR_PEP_ID=MMETSP0371-20130417/121515_1 /TAXON_ID=268820 /ORGANISM="Peridinium aciculiferum, Strain PAER-2" /LENGTH=48 /DNA_ID= /DNA_START= /DNA_END= /DNA_ORIENTATION=
MSSLTAWVAANTGLTTMSSGTVLRWVALEEQFAPCWQLLYDVLQLRIR